MAAIFWWQLHRVSPIWLQTRNRSSEVTASNALHSKISIVSWKNNQQPLISSSRISARENHTKVMCANLLSHRAHGSLSCLSSWMNEMLLTQCSLLEIIWKPHFVPALFSISDCASVKSNWTFWQVRISFVLTTKFIDNGMKRFRGKSKM